MKHLLWIVVGTLGLGGLSGCAMDSTAAAQLPGASWENLGEVPCDVEVPGQSGVVQLYADVGGEDVQAVQFTACDYTYFGGTEPFHFECSLGTHAIRVEGRTLITCGTRVIREGETYGNRAERVLAQVLR